MKKVKETLEFNKIIEHLNRHTSCSLGKDLILQMKKFDDLESLQMELSETDEVLRLCFAYGKLSLGGLHDLSLPLKKSMMDGMLLPHQLLDVVAHIDCVNHVLNYQKQNQLETPYFKEATEGLIELKNLKQAIEKAITRDGEVADHASTELARIRRQIRHMENQIKVKMNQYLSTHKDYLSESLVTSRNDRYVIPVKMAYQHQVGGIVHGQSASHQTAYIEPEAIVLMNNQLSQLKSSEQEEIERILYALSALVKQESSYIFDNQEILARLDFLFAKGAYAKELDATIPRVDDCFDTLLLKNARHPLLDCKTVVANTVEINKPHHMMLITGSNTGGKTVTLKTVGLLSLMALTGMAIPCDVGVVPFFDDIFVDLGDEQSIEQSLSTFSSHMSRLVHITDNVTSHSLVLMDEVGSGTDPREGESIAQAILEYLAEYHCFVIATTHYSSLKTFAKATDYILVASVAFDEEQFKPTYRLILGESGKSYALEISTRLGLNQKIVDLARKIKQNQQSHQEQILEQLELEMEEARLRQEKYDQLNVELEKEKNKYKHRQEVFERERERYLDQAKKQANELIEKALLDIDTLMQEFKQKGKEVKMHEVIEAKHQLETLKHQKKQEVLEEDLHEYHVGEIVRILSMNREGEIVEIKKDSFIISMGGLKVQMKKQDVRFVRKQGKKAPIKTRGKSILKKTGSYEINVVGMRYEEAMRVVDKFLDDALVTGYPNVRIVHGMGTGVLRKGVIHLLNKNKHVKSFRQGGPQEGGLGVTIAYFE